MARLHRSRVCSTGLVSPHPLSLRARACSPGGVALLALSLVAAADARAEEAPAKQQALLVIVHPKNPLRELSRAQLDAYFRKKVRRWPDGKPILLLNHVARDPARVAFDRRVLNMSPRQAADFWIKEQIRGRGRPPTSVKRARD
jgi:hypothetical protein